MATLKSRLLRELGRGGPPVATSTLALLFGKPRGHVWGELIDLERAGLVERVRRLPATVTSYHGGLPGRGRWGRQNRKVTGWVATNAGA